MHTLYLLLLVASFILLVIASAAAAVKKEWALTLLCAGIGCWELVGLIQVSRLPS